MVLSVMAKLISAIPLVGVTGAGVATDPVEPDIGLTIKWIGFAGLTAEPSKCIAATCRLKTKNIKISSHFLQ